jgi:predicted phosphoadenosine phosphosulfate sulfurtransferase
MPVSIHHKGRVPMGVSVLDAAVDRIAEQMEAGHRLVVSFSAGKDSTVVLETALMAARRTGYGRLDVVLRDEEILLPGTYEFAERTAERPEVNFHWLVAHQPILNIYNRAMPYFWVMDPQLPRSQWFREPPSYAIDIDEMNIEAMTIPKRFPPPEGRDLIAVIGLRGQESRQRLYGLFSSGGPLTLKNRWGTRSLRPVYDWTDGDVWKAIGEFGWDYAPCYDVMYRLGLPRSHLRVAPPTMSVAGVGRLQATARAYPQWFDRMCERLPGVRAGARFGLRAVQPVRHLGESWEQVFWRECAGPKTPAWIKQRALRVADRLVKTHKRHSTQPLPEVEPCRTCMGNAGAWKQIALRMYNGDPFSTFGGSLLPYVEPEFFRPGGGTWNGGSPG